MNLKTPTSLSIIVCILVDITLVLFSAFSGGHDSFQKTLYIIILFWWLPFWMLDQSYKQIITQPLFKENPS